MRNVLQPVANQMSNGLSANYCIERGAHDFYVREREHGRPSKGFRVLALDSNGTVFSVLEHCGTKEQGEEHIKTITQTMRLINQQK